MQVTDEMVDAIGRELYHRRKDVLADGSTVTTGAWDKLDPAMREWTRERIRKGLEKIVPSIIGQGVRITDDIVERGAKALLALHGGQEAVDNYPKMVPQVREKWQTRARAVLEAVLGDGRGQGITDEIVEAAARAMYERKRSLLEGIKPLPWDAIPRFAQDEWREIARAGLKAAGTVTAVHLCDTCAQSMCRRRRDIEDACEDPLFPARAVVVACKAYVADKRVEEVLQGV